MKKLNILLFFISIQILGQSTDQSANWKNQVLNDPDLHAKEYKDSLTKYDFSILWTHTVNTQVFGYIGENFERLRIKIISAKKDSSVSDMYTIYGKSKVKNNICEFKGTIKISNIRIYWVKHFGVDDEYKNKAIQGQGILLGNYSFKEDSNQTDAGIFEGVLSSKWFIDKKGKLQYDDIENISDSYCNNQFVGTWKGYKNKIPKICNWGDWRIPFSNEFDCGTGEFYPCEQYSEYGWKTFHEANSNPPNKTARIEEEKQWWLK